MIAASALGQIILTAVVVSAATGALTLGALRLERRAAMLARMMILVGGSTVATAGATIAIGAEMYLSGHDLAVLCWVIGIGAVASMLVAASIGARITRTAHKLTETALAIGAGEVVRPASHDGREFTVLSEQLAATSEKLAAAREEVAILDQSRRRLVAWISHDLRTPLAALQAMAESLEDGVADDPDRYHRQIRGQAETLARMVDDLFELSKIQSGTLRLNLEPLSLFDLVSDAVADLHAVAAARSITLRESQTGDLTLWGDPRELARVIGNLLMNAIQHSPDNSEILISARETKHQHVALSVIDAGGGIPDEDLGRIFDAGWRGTSARTPEPRNGVSAGAGLGLAIVQGIVEAHAGLVTVKNVSGGCRFEVTLPRLGGAREPGLARADPRTGLV
jgi:signal transduction histidine kinase